ncbi:uncharacterized protein LOC123520518 [Portunus trituberculatus]|uniref:uncharacterized protein LOC123520518 n=1 Tax=Portunus trituberculatus TaxID=210409 RepID=UPI001E1CE789|nr:uncharacterized protein LOC123520518 [Portunus trituberculatus]
MDGTTARRVAPGRFHTQQSHRHSPRHLLPRLLASFSLLDATPPHPHYRPTEGQPLINMPYYLEVTLVGHLESKVAMVSGVQFIDKEGDVLREIDYVPPVKDQAYMWTSPLPDHPFYVRILGYLVSGNPWARQMPVEVWPVETLVELFSTTDDLSAPPGGRATAKFMVVNYGLESNFDITVTDDLNFLDTINPKRVFLANNQTALVEVSFQVPPTATHGQVSTVLVTARSQVQKLSYNTALTHFFVLPTLLDTDSPTCVLDHMPSCAGFTNNGLCSTKNWNVTATLQDHGSGLYLVTAVPDEHNMIVPNFPPGTTSEVYMQYQTDCCTTHVQIRGVDALGNVGDCDEIDMGKLGGLIYYLEVEMAGNTWLAVRWNISNSSVPVSHYNLWLDGQFLHQIPCHEDSCADHINYLEPCTKHNFTVNPVFYYLGGTVEGMGRSTTGTTMEEVPETPISGREIDATETSVTIAWESANPDCSFKYEVCTHEVNTSPSTAVCHETFDTYTTIAGLEECRAYNSDVRALSHAYNTSSPLTFYSVTLCVDIP